MSCFCQYSFIAALIFASSSSAMYKGKPQSGMPSIVSYATAKDTCNGTFFLANPGQPEIMLTSTHCLTHYSEKAATITSGKSRGKRSLGRVISDTAGKNGELVSEADVAMLLFPPGTAEGVIALSTEPAKPNDPVTVSAWGPNARIKEGGPNRILDYNYRESDQTPFGYLLHENSGTVPDADGESGSPLITDKGLIGVFTGNTSLRDVEPYRIDGKAAVYAAIHAEAILRFIDDFIRTRPAPFAGLDLSRFIVLQSIEAVAPPVKIAMASVVQAPQAVSAPVGTEPEPEAEVTVTPLSPSLRYVLETERAPRAITDSSVSRGLRRDLKSDLR